MIEEWTTTAKGKPQQNLFYGIPCAKDKRREKELPQRAAVSACIPIYLPKEA
jgi:hypothetical protein